MTLSLTTIFFIIIDFDGNANTDWQKDEFSLYLKCVYLFFSGPFHTTVTTSLTLTNPTDKVIMFKIKTTVPKRYCVRPNCGTLDPKDTAEILISLQPSGFDPNEKNKHKFMIQSLIAPEGEMDPDQVVSV
jgi:MSP (Major sperm protein) domain